MARQREDEKPWDTSIPCSAEEFFDARVTGREETMRIIEGLTCQFLEDIASGRTPEIHLVGLSTCTVYSSCMLTCAVCVRS